MNYAEARPRIRSGDVILLSYNKWSSWYDIQVMAVRLFRMSEYCHVGVAWVIGGRVFILHAIGAGVSITPLSHELPFYWIQRNEWTPVAEEFALATVGQAYSKWQVILAGLGLLRGGADNDWECGEFANGVLERCGARLGTAYTPDEIARELLTFGYSISLVEG